MATSYITNDPWKGTGHLFDLTVVTPIFLDGRAVALFASTTHVVDIGGLGVSAEGRQIYHEGLYIPLMYLAREGQMNEDLIGMVRANVREPVQVVGDIYALIACNEKGGKRLVEMMREFELRDLDHLGEEIITRSRRAMADVIARLPQGSWSAKMTIDGYEAPVTLAATLTIAGDRVLVDYTGTSGLSRYAINCPICYTDAYTAFGVKAALAPWIPNNTGTLDAVIVTAPENTIVNAPHPAAVYARSVIGHMLPDVVYGCLDQAMPDTVPAEGTSSLWNLSLLAGHGLTGSEGSAVRAFNVTTFHSGGAGARPRQDGLSATPFPSGVRNVPVEITEAITPLVVWKKEFRRGSGGPGRQRGGLGQRMEIENRDAAAFGIQARFERGEYPARGRSGGAPGGLGRLSLGSGHRAEGEGLPARAARRPADRRDARRRRLWRPLHARSGAGGARRALRPDRGGAGRGRLRRHPDGHGRTGCRGNGTATRRAIARGRGGAASRPAGGPLADAPGPVSDAGQPERSRQDAALPDAERRHTQHPQDDDAERP